MGFLQMGIRHRRCARSSNRRKQLGRILKNFITLNRVVLIKCLPRPQSGKQLDPAEQGLADCCG